MIIPPESQSPLKSPFKNILCQLIAISCSYRVKNTISLANIAVFATSNLAEFRILIYICADKHGNKTVENTEYGTYTNKDLKSNPEF